MGARKKKQGLIIVAYPGMGQSIFPEVYTNYNYISMYDGWIDSDKEPERYQEKCTTWSQRYVKMAIGLVTGGKGKFDVCFIDAHPDVINELDNLKQPFLIFYPSTTQQSVLRILAYRYLKNPTVWAGKEIADVILHHDEKIALLKQYANSISSSTGIIKEEILDLLLDMDHETRTKTMVAMSKLKMQKMRQKDDISDANQVN